MAIRAHHVDNGNAHRDVVLIAASAVMAGLKVVAVATDGFGNVDIYDFKHQISVHEENLAVIMVSYP